MDKALRHVARLRGTVVVPGDKSVSHRAMMIGSIAEGTTEIIGSLDAADPRSTLACLRSLGVRTTLAGDTLTIEGNGLRGFREPQGVLDAGNSGTTIRLLSGILAGQRFPTQISGDQYLVRRPMKRIIDPLTEMGAHIVGTERFTAPLKIFPSDHLRGISYELPIPSAQVKSAVLFAGLYADGSTTVVEHHASRDHTERMLGLTPSRSNGETRVTVTGGTRIAARQFVVGGDPSSAAFFVVAALIAKDAEVLIRNVGVNPTRVGFIEVLTSMGGAITLENRRTVGGEPIADVAVKSSALASSVRLEGDLIPNVIDEVPILAVAGAFSHGSFEVRDAFELRNKECDRIGAVCENLRLMGVDVEEFEDGFAFQGGGGLHSAPFDSYGDHRIAMAFGVAAASLQGESVIKDSECVDISYPSFWETLHRLGD